MMTSLKMLFIPLDNRPVSYCLPENIAEIKGDIKISLPPREIIGGLAFNSDIDGIFNWLKTEIETLKPDIIVTCLDTIAYGGLIPSRRSMDDYEDIKKRILTFRKIVSKSSAKIYAFSSIMRISNNNVNEEEKLYWDKYGELIFKMSYLTHKSNFENLKDELQEVKNLIPADIIEDYLKTRKRNFEINKFYIEMLKENFFETLVFSQDDTAEFGLNVMEKNSLQDLIKENNLQNGIIKTGADEIPSSLISRAVLDFTGTQPKIFPLFLNENSKHIVSRYEDVDIEQSTLGQIELAGTKVSENLEDADIVLILNTPITSQNDLCMRVFTDSSNDFLVSKIIEFLKTNQKPFMLADIRNANGGDDLLVREFLEFQKNKLFLGYSGWNTTGNTLGSLIATGIMEFISKNNDEKAFLKSQFIRFMDDWAYQTHVRFDIREKNTPELLEELISTYEEKVKNFLGIKKLSVKYSYPWDRTFEVEVSPNIKEIN